MSVILFFGVSLFVVLVGFVYVGMTIRHHWLQNRLDKEKKA